MASSKSLRKVFTATIFLFRTRLFNPSKCKAEAKMATARIKLLRNKRKEQILQMKRDIAKLLESGQEDIARIRVEHVIREQNILAANEIIELFCDLVVNRLPIISKEKNCPADLREGISSLIFAAPRCSELPELLRIRDIFEKKYGKDFALAASELRPDSCVNRLLIEKLSVKKPNGETKLKAMKIIAKECNVNWDPAETEQELLKLPEDRLSGPSSFVSGVNLPMRMQNTNNSIPTQFSNSNNSIPTQFSNSNNCTPAQFSNSNNSIPTQFSNSNNATPAQFSNSNNSTPAQFSNSNKSSNNSTPTQLSNSSNNSTGMQFVDTASAARAAAKYAAKAAQAASSAADLSKQERERSENSLTSFKSTKKQFSLDNGSNGSDDEEEFEEEVDSEERVVVKFDESDEEEREGLGFKKGGGFVGEERESSGGSKVHPKMPDYEELTARFEKLRSSGRKI